MKIEIEQTSMGMWIGKVINGWNVEHEVRGMEREEVLLKLLGLMEVTVKYHGTHWVNGKQYPWEVVNRV